MSDNIAKPAARRISVSASLWAAALFGTALLLVYHQTTWSMVSIWIRSETFAHGFLILPISLWLIWNQRDRLRLLQPRPALWIAFLIIPPGFVWLLAILVDVLVIQQLALVSMLVVGAWAILGHRLARALAFPLLFLFLAVPMGEALVDPMMEFTASTTVWLIQQTGVPVYREGLYFTLPSGNWSVVEACSGVRYIIASVTLGLLYAYLTYRSLWRQLLFVLVSAIVPIFANTARAFIIVMLGHWSDMTIATGADHLIYGWVFFGLVMFLLFWLGSFFREEYAEQAVGGPTDAENPQGAGATFTALSATVLVAVVVAAMWPLLANTVESGQDSTAPVDIRLPSGNAAWSVASEPGWQWSPENVAGGQAAAYYARNGQTLGLFVQYFDGTTSGEVVGSSRRFAEKDSIMRVVARDKVEAELANIPVVVDEAQLRGADGQLLAWSWYRIGDLDTSNDYIAKFLEARASLGLGRHGSWRVVLVVPYQDSVSLAQTVLHGFLREHGGGLDEALDRASAE